MTMTGHGSEVGAIPVAPRADDWFGAVVRAGAQLEQRLSSPDRLDEIAVRLAAVAMQLDCRMVTGASHVGDQLAGVLAARSGGRLALWAQNGTPGTVLIVDGILASGVQIASAARRARQSGAQRVVGAAVLADPAGLAMCRDDLGDEVVALEEMAAAERT